jgi:hypothetical protein
MRRMMLKRGEKEPLAMNSFASPPCYVGYVHEHVHVYLVKGERKRE